MRPTRRAMLRGLGALALGLPVSALVRPSRSEAAPGLAKRVLFFYFPDGVAGPSQNGEPSLWHCTGSEHLFELGLQLEPLAAFKDDCVFLNGLTMGGTDSGSHPGGAKKLLTAVDHAGGESIDQYLARTAGSGAPFKHLYLGAMANEGNASGDQHISYPTAGQSVTPEDDPRAAFELLFGGYQPSVPAGEPAVNIDPVEVSVIDAVLDDMHRLQTKLGKVEKSKLDLHLEALREVEKRVKGEVSPVAVATCDDPSLDASGVTDATLYDPSHFPDVLRSQIDVMVQAMACGLTQVGTLQCSHHTSELIMSRFPGTEMYDPGFDMRSHQASHYGATHDFGKKELAAYVAQRRYWVSQFAYLLDRLDSLPEGDGTMLDHSLVLLCTEVCDGNTHLHDNMPFVLAGRAGGALSTGRLLSFDNRRHGDLFASMAHAMGEPLAGFGDASAGPLPGLI